MTESKVDVQSAREALDSLDDYARMGVGVDAHGPRGMLERFIAQQAELIEAARVIDANAAFADYPERKRLRAALAACTPAKSEGR